MSNSESADPRFTFGLITDICDVLHKHGYHRPDDGQGYDRATGSAIGTLLQLTRQFEGVTREPTSTSPEHGGGSCVEQ